MIIIKKVDTIIIIRNNINIIVITSYTLKFINKTNHNLIKIIINIFKIFLNIKLEHQVNKLGQVFYLYVL